MSGSSSSKEITVDAYKKGVKARNLKIDYEIIRFEGFDDKVSEAGEIVDLTEAAKSGTKVLVSVINKGNASPGKRYYIDAAYMTCAQGDPNQKYIQETVELSLKKHSEIVTEFSLTDDGEGQEEINWYKQWKGTDVNSVWPIRCKQLSLKSVFMR